MNIFGVVEKHPYMTAGAVFVVGLVLVLALSGGSEAPQQDSGPQGVNQDAYMAYAAQAAGANAQLSQNQLAAQVASKVSDNEVLIKQSDNTTAFQIATANFDMQNKAAVLAATTAARAFESADYQSNLKYTTDQHLNDNATALATAQSANALALGLRQSDNSTQLGMHEVSQAAAVAIRGYQSADLAVNASAHSVDLQTEAKKIIALADFDTAKFITTSNNNVAMTKNQNEYLSTMDKQNRDQVTAFKEMAYEANKSHLERLLERDKLQRQAEKEARDRAENHLERLLEYKKLKS